MKSFKEQLPEYQRPIIVQVDFNNEYAKFVAKLCNTDAQGHHLDIFSEIKRPLVYWDTKIIEKRFADIWFWKYIE